MRLYRFIQRERTKQGRVVYYFRRGQPPRIRLPDDPGSAEFEKAYFAALHEHPIILARKPTKSELTRAKVEKAATKAVASARQRARQRGFEFTLASENVVEIVRSQNYCCAMTGIPFFSKNYTRSSRHPYALSLDRIDARQGYTPDNVRVVVFALNMMLSDWGQEVFDQVINAYKHHKRRKSIPGPEGHEPAPETIFNENNGIAP